MKIEQHGPKIRGKDHDTKTVNEVAKPELTKKLILKHLPVKNELIYASADAGYKTDWTMRKEIESLAENIAKILRTSKNGRYLAREIEPLIAEYNEKREENISDIIKTTGKKELTPLEISTWGIPSRLFLYEKEEYLDISWGSAYLAQKVVLRTKRRLKSQTK